MIDINEEIKKLNWAKEPKGLYEPIGYTLEAGGKRIRPTLAILGCELFGGKVKDAIPAALALEIYHNHTLLHDDVMDHSDTRRGRATVWKRWNENTAILSGDQMLIEAFKILGKTPSSKLPEVLRLFAKMASDICEGQQYDMDFENRKDVRIEEYIEMIRLKTSVLLATALQIGAYIAGAELEHQQKVYEFGIHVGLAFQIQDDILDCFGDPETFGKPIGGDIRESKKTYLFLSAWDKASEEERKILLSKDVKEVTKLYVKLKVREECESIMTSHTQQALNILSSLPQNEANKALKSLAEKLLNRNK